MADSTALLSVEFTEGRVRLDERILPLRGRFVDLYCYLAAVRATDPFGNGGWVDCEQVQNLGSWSRNQAISVGKQISRHVGKMSKAGLDLIESRQKVMGPFRIALAPSQLRLDIDAAEIIERLTVSRSSLGSQSEESAFEFSEHYWRGVNDFHYGKLSQSLTSFRTAVSKAATAQQRLSASFYAQRILERQGQFEEAEALRRERLPDLASAGKHQLWAQARDLVLAAWREYRNDRIDSAESMYRKALERAQRQGPFEVLGDIHNGLGEIAKRRGEYQEALRHYLEALDVWLLTDYFYGFQAVYFNIGVLYRSWGDQMQHGGHAYQAKQMYGLAAQWTERCIRLCEAMWVGNDTSEAEAQLASLYLKLGKYGKAFTTAVTAQQMAFRAKNQRSILASARALAAAYLARGEPEEAVAVVRKSSDSLTEKFRQGLAAQISRFFH